MTGWLAYVRDASIILLAISELVLIVVLIVIALQIRRLIGLLQTTLHDQVPPIMGSLRDTATSVQATADFVGTTVARPIIDTVSFLAALRRFLAIFVVGRRSEGRPAGRPSGVTETR